MLGFKEWLLSEIRHFGLAKPTTIALPDAKGRPIRLNVSYIDPRFELYNPTATLRDPNTGDLIEIPWQKLVVNGGTGWAGPLPFTNHLAIIYDSKSPYGMIGPVGNLPRLPDDWYREAEFADATGSVIYYAREGIYNTPDPRHVAV